MAMDEGREMGMSDPAQVGITGYSRGTEQAAQAVMRTNLFQAASGVAGDTSPYFYNMAEDVIKRSFREQGLGGPVSGAMQRWKQVSAELNTDKIRTPILNNDPESEALADLGLFTALKESKKPIELIIYPDELHHINQPAHRYQIYERNVDWFRFWLKDEEDPDPAKADQYVRWRDLREQRDANRAN